jgi:hypothetical protein
MAVPLRSKEGRRSGGGGALGILRRRNNGRLTVCSLEARSFYAAHQQYNVSEEKCAKDG